ncbi:MAG: hypothetical protein HY263_08750 [Chloroflexi bacterium]|nr:hypothetical protein [Chloroflexota bacterium]
MKPDRIEELLRRRPPDEPLHSINLELDEPAADLLRVRRTSLGATGLGSLRWASLAAAVALVAVLGSLVVGRTPAAPTGSPGGSPVASEGVPTTPPGAIAWIDEPYVIPTPEPTEPPSALPLCDPTRLAVVAGGWGGATGSAAGGVTIVNVSQVRCRLDPPIEAALRDAGGTVVASREPTARGSGSGLEAIGLGEAGSAWAIVVWNNWCGAAAPPGPLELDLTMPAADGSGGQLLRTEVKVDEPGYSTPRCDAPEAGSGLGVLQFQSTGEGSGGTDLKPCVAADLLAWSGDWGAAAGTWYSEIAVLNVSGVDCLFPAGPTVELRDASGDIAIASEAGGPLPSPATFVLPAGSSAGSWLAFANWCAAPPPLPLRADVVLGDSRLDVAPMPDEFATIPVPPCMGDPAASSAPGFDPAPFRLPDAPEPPPSDPGDSLPFKVTIPPLPTASPGSTYVYVVTLTNTSVYDKPINLSGDCPSYIQRLFLPGEQGSIDTRRLLNCGPAGVLTLGLSATFEMRLEIPSDASPGKATLVWQLGDRGEGVKTTFQIAESTPSP